MDPKKVTRFQESQSLSDTLDKDEGAYWYKFKSQSQSNLLSFWRDNCYIFANPHQRGPLNQPKGKKKIKKCVYIFLFTNTSGILFLHLIAPIATMLLLLLLLLLWSWRSRLFFVVVDQQPSLSRKWSFFAEFFKTSFFTLREMAAVNFESLTRENRTRDRMSQKSMNVCFSFLRIVIMVHVANYVYLMQNKHIQNFKSCSIYVTTF